MSGFENNKHIGIIIVILTFGTVFFFASRPPQYLRLLELECPRCNETSLFGITRHYPQGVSHIEIVYCPKCYISFRIRVYYDGIVVVEK